MSKRTCFQRNVILNGVAAAALILFAGGASAAEAPSNDELYRMILELEANQERLYEEAEQARARAAAAEAELERTRREFAAARQALEQTQKIVTTTRKDVRSVLDTAPSGSVVKVANNPQGFQVMAEALFLRPSTDQLDFVIANPENNFSPQIGSQLVAVDPNHDAGFRVGAGWAFCCGMDVMVKFSRLEADASESVSKPSGGTLNTTVFPTDSGNFDADDATARYDLEYTVIDLEVGQSFVVGEDVNIRVLGGVRYANIDQDFDVTYFGGKFGSTPGIIDNSVELTAIGPRIGAEGSWEVGGGFGIFGGLATSLLVGDFDLNYLADEDADRTDPDFAFAEGDTTSLIPVLEANLGLGWQGQLGRISMSARAGYQFEQWFNTFNVAQFPDDALNAHLINDRTDLGLDGPFVRVKATF